MRKENGGSREEKEIHVALSRECCRDDKLGSESRCQRRVSPSVRVTSVGGQRMPTCGLVLGEVTLLGEEGTGQHLKSNPASFYPGLTN